MRPGARLLQLLIVVEPGEVVEEDVLQQPLLQPQGQGLGQLLLRAPDGVVGAVEDVGGVVGIEDVVEGLFVLHVAEGGGDVGVHVVQPGERPDLLHVPVPPVPQVGGDTPQLGEGRGHRQQVLGAGHVHPGVPHVADQEHVRPLHLLEHGKEPLIVQGEVLELRVDLHPVDAVVPQPLQLLPVVFILGVEGAAGDELGVLLALLADEAVDGLHLVGGGGGGEHHGVLDPRLRQHVRQLLDLPVVVGGLRQVEVLGGGHGGLLRHLVREDVGVHVDDSHGYAPPLRIETSCAVGAPR